MNGQAREGMRQLESKTMLVHVNKIVDEAIDIKSFELVSADGQLLPSFTPGSHIDVHIANDIIRQYSLCNGPDNTHSYLIAVKKEAASRGGSLAMHEKIKVGDTLFIGMPRNNFSLIPQAKRHVLLGGGIGITPLLSMARHLLAAGADFELHYFSRSVKHTAFHEVFSGLEFKGKVVFHHALEADAVRACLRELLGSWPEGAHLYLCGPRFFMDQVEAAATAAWPAQAVRSYPGTERRYLCHSRRAKYCRRARSTRGPDRSVLRARGVWNVHDWGGFWNTGPQRCVSQPRGKGRGGCDAPLCVTLQVTQAGSRSLGADHR
jgi:ferredoxin-NADP reductase